MEILLKNIELFGLHGVNPLENRVGTGFIVNICIRLNTNKQVESLQDTIDYSVVYAILKSEFEKTEELLEVLAQRIIATISTRFPSLREIDIEILKTNPTIEGFSGMLGIRTKKTIDEN